jgi:hypothetical protein
LRTTRTAQPKDLHFAFSLLVVIPGGNLRLLLFFWLSFRSAAKESAVPFPTHCLHL